ncbi:MAG: hypothetical protein VXX70_07995, partial [Bacteroidota bacterium]|nr:hypothetical protein [Bacteroidota bacterium]
EVRLGTRVAAVAADRVELESGEAVEGSGVISSIEGRSDVKWNSCFNAVFKTTASRFGQPIIGLLRAAESVTNVHFMEDVQGEEGRGKLNVTALPGSNGVVDVVAMEHAVRRDLEVAGLQPGAMLWHTVIHQALPQLNVVRSSPRAIRNEAGVHLAGDHLAAPSLDAALRSGRMAAESLMAQP